MRRPLIVVLILVLLAGAALLRPGAFTFAARSDALEQALFTAGAPEDHGISLFAFGDWGALSSDTLATSGQPWKLTTAALALQAAGMGDVAGTDIAALYKRYGFLTTTRVFGNWPPGFDQPTTDSPLGLNTAFAGRIWPPIGATIGNIGCAACHASVMYDATGAPLTDQVWLGAPNGSINLQAWTRDLYAALRDQTGDADRLMDAVMALFPDTGLRERMTLRYAILPRLRDVIADRAAIGGLVPFRASLAGATNGLDSLRNRLGLIPQGTVLTESIFNSVPDLGDRMLRTRLLNSGTYAIPASVEGTVMTPAEVTPDHRAALAGIVAFFTVPSMGVTPDVARAHIPDAVAVTDWIVAYRPPPFPGTVDRTIVPRGAEVYRAACSACHGSYDGNLMEPRLASFPNWEGDVGTDPERARLLTQEIADAVTAVFGDIITTRTVATYAAPPLTGLWSSAPYLHNGSVPTLWHLMHPDSRPIGFEVGGHRLDLTRVGIDLAPAPGYVPWSEPATVDTRAFGLSAAGHEVGFAGLSDADKAALLEFLKLL